MSLAVVVISHDKRLDKLDEVCRSVLWQRPDEFVIVSDSAIAGSGSWGKDCTWLVMPPVTMTTVDALIKRDVGWMATESDHICFLSDDHALGSNFVRTFRDTYEYKGDWDILCPQRFCWVPGDMAGTPHPDPSGREHEVWLNVGQKEGYTSGHCGIYKRWVNRTLPWMAGTHHRNWDLLQTHEQVRLGAKLQYADRTLAVIDLEPEAMPWLS